jgi:hypothetical protein
VDKNTPEKIECDRTSPGHPRSQTPDQQVHPNPSDRRRRLLATRHGRRPGRGGERRSRRGRGAGQPARPRRVAGRRARLGPCRGGERRSRRGRGAGRPARPGRVAGRRARTGPWRGGGRRPRHWHGGGRRPRKRHVGGRCWFSFSFGFISVAGRVSILHELISKCSTRR